MAKKQSKTPPPSLSISIVVCCYNSSPRLPRLFESLDRLIRFNPCLDFELILVDNASTDLTAHSIDKYMSMNREHCYKVFEPMPGLINARRAGVNAASNTIIAFLDDDNMPEADFCEQILDIFASNKQVRSLSVSSFSTEFPYDKPVFAKYESNYAVGPICKHSHLVPNTNVAGWGAGFSAYTSDLKAIFENQDIQFLLSGRIGSKQLSGDDTELFWLLKFAGLNMFCSAKQLFEHRIDKKRFTLNYLLIMFSGNGESSLPLELYNLIYNNRDLRLLHAITLVLLKDLIWIPRRLYYHLRIRPFFVGVLLDLVYLYGRYKHFYKLPYYLSAIRSNHRLLSC